MNCCDEYGNCTQGKDCPVRCCNGDCNQGRNCSYRTEEISKFDVYALGIIFFVLLLILFVV